MTTIILLPKYKVWFRFAPGVEVYYFRRNVWKIMRQDLSLGPCNFASASRDWPEQREASCTSAVDLACTLSESIRIVIRIPVVQWVICSG